MYSCPACNAPDIGGRSVCHCGADLSLLRSLEALPDVWFNEALRHLDAGRPGRALEYLAACCTARPTDAAALRVLAQAWLLLDRWREAGDALRRASELEPDAPGLPRLQAALTAVRRQGLRQAWATRPATQRKRPTPHRRLRHG